MTIRRSLLGLAFAAADLLLEIDGDGRIRMALGSSPTGAGSAEGLGGQPLLDVVGKASRTVLRQALAELKPGRRSPALDIVLTVDAGLVRRGTARLFSLPDLAPAISCAISFEGAPFRLDLLSAPPVLSSAGFLERTHRALLGPGEEPCELSVAFIDVAGLAEAAGKDEAGRRTLDRVESALQAASVDGASAARLADDRYAVLRAADDTLDIVGEVAEAARAEGVDIAVRGADVGLGGAAAPVHALRALRFAVEGCLKDEGLQNPEMTFTASLMRTLKDADRFRAVVRERRFDLHYQPIVDLKTGAATHFEALARFSADASPADTIHMAEELALIEGFDLAVAEKAITRLRQPGAGLFKFAVNVSASSLSADSYVQNLLRLTAVSPEVRRRLIVEVTETAALADPAAADRRLAALRGAGIKVCIDDFGSGSAGFDYLRRLSVDAVKIDGGLVDGFEQDLRATQVIRHIVEMCREMNLAVIAEHVETEACLEALVALGVNQGQGYLFGRPASEPRLPRTEAVRRKGELEAWA
ncbi:EAL domain-containing protein [Brevundimonas balnearis]|uniref:EAL domain-containing protein n=1 Tax=Brevundimonas balnearis TaxID=1572858 RepID=A0ABV6R3Z1_9CAUL